MKYMIVRDGSAVLYGQFGTQHVRLGDVVIFAPYTLFCYEPEGWLTRTTLCLDRDFLVDQVFWQQSAAFVDRLHAKEVVDACLAVGARVLRLGEVRTGALMPWLDELVLLSAEGFEPDRFFRGQSLILAVLDVLSPHLQSAVRAPNRVSRPSGHPAAPRHRPFSPIRQEIRLAALLLRENPERQWTLGVLASEVHLSASQLGRLFVDAFGKTPVAFLTIARAERMAQLLRTTDLPIGKVAREVGWSDPEYAGRQFRRSLGLSPRGYRSMTRRVPS